MHYLGTYKNGYCGCDEEIGIIADNMQDVEEYMREGMDVYAERHESVAMEEWERQVEDGETDGDEEFYDSQVYEDYLGDICYTVKECTEDDSSSWVDIRSEENK